MLFRSEDGSNVSAVVIGEGMDTGDKATNKAMAIAFKYACFQVFCIPTEEMQDPDAKIPEPSEKKKPDSDVSKAADSKKIIQEDKIRELEQLLKKNKIQPQTIYVLYRVNSLEELSDVKYRNIIDHLKEIKEQQDIHYQYT